MIEQFYGTPTAAILLGISQNSLKRCRDLYGGFLIAGEDYIPPASARGAAITWNVEGCRKKFAYRGKLRVQGDSIRKELLTEAK